MAKKRRSRNLRALGQNEYYGSESDALDYYMPYDAGGGFDTDYAPATDAGVISAFQQKFADAVNELDAQANALDDAVNNLYAVRDVAATDAADAAEWENQAYRVGIAKETLDSARAAVATVGGWWTSAKKTIGLAGLRTTPQAGVKNSQLGMLGVLPVVPWATLGIIAGGAAAIAGVVASVNSFIDKMNLKAWNDENIRRSRAGELPLPDSSRPVALSSPSIFAGATDLTKALIFGAIAFFVLPMVFKGRR